VVKVLSILQVNQSSTHLQLVRFNLTVFLQSHLIQISEAKSMRVILYCLTLNYKTFCMIFNVSKE